LWGILAQKIYEGGWEAKMQQELISRIQSQMKKFDPNFLQSLMGGVKTKLRAIASPLEKIIIISKGIQVKMNVLGETQIILRTISMILLRIREQTLMKHLQIKRVKSIIKVIIRRII
jgi:hypothetical protein